MSKARKHSSKKAPEASTKDATIFVIAIIAIILTIASLVVFDIVDIGSIARFIWDIIL